jgi:transcriptional regulator with XRE-family HTH domain
MSMKSWEEKVLQAPGAPERVGAIEDELRLAAGLTALREQAGLSQRELARLIGVSQPRIAAIERSRNVTIDVLEQYAKAVGGRLEVAVVTGQRKVSLLSGASRAPKTRRSRIDADADAPSQAASRQRVSAKSSHGASVVVAQEPGL